MPANLKKMVRTRMEKTGESYATALKYVRRRGEKRRLRRAAPQAAAATAPAARRRWRYQGAVARDARIDAYVRAVPEPLAPLVASLVALVRRAVPGHDEVLTHGAPQFCIASEPFCYVVHHARHVNLGFCDGASLPDPARLLEGTGKTMRHVKLKPGAPPPMAGLSQLVVHAARTVRARQQSDRRAGNGPAK